MRPTCDTDGIDAAVDAPIGRPFPVRMDVIWCAMENAWRSNPRKGKATATGTVDKQRKRQFTPPNAGELFAGVLVLDDAAKEYAASGRSKLTTGFKC